MFMCPWFHVLILSQPIHLKFQTGYFSHVTLTVVNFELNFETVLYIATCLPHRRSAISMTSLQDANLDIFFLIGIDVDTILFYVNNKIYIYPII